MKRIAHGIDGWKLFLTALSFIFIPFPSSADITVQRYPELIDPSRVTVAAKQRELGNDVEKLFAYVRDNIRHDSYRGVLRGGNGTLISEAGNSLDKAVLLSELLKRAGHKSRFARGMLEAANAEALLKAIFQIKAPASKGTATPNAEAKAFIESVKKATEDQYNTIVKTLTESGFKIPKDPVFSRQNLIEEIRDHYWVQYLRGNEWVDLDPSFPGSKIGQKYAQVKETVERIPDNLFHRVVIRVVLEEQKEGRIQKRILLPYEFKASEFSGQSIILTHQPGSWTQPKPMSALAKALTGAMDRITNILGGIGGEEPAGPAYEDRARPVLVIGNDNYKAGDVFDIPHPQNEGRGGGKPVKTPAVAEWIEFEFHAPDGKISKTERTIFDRVGFAARRKGRSEVSPSPLGIEHPLNGVFCLSFYNGLLTNEAMFLKQDGRETTEKVPTGASLSASETDKFLKGFNHAVHLLSDLFLLPLMIEGQQVVYSSTSPRVIISALRFSPTSTTFSVDLRHARYRPIATSQALYEKTFYLQVLKGVLAGVIESSIADPVLAPAGPTPHKVKPGSYSTARIFQESARQGITPKLLTDAATGAGPTLPADPAARIAAEIGQGNLVIIPSKSVSLAGRTRTAWWRIERRTGETVAVTEDGLHQDHIEVIANQSGTYDMFMIEKTARGASVVTPELNVSLAHAIEICRMALEAGFRVRFLGMIGFAG